MKQPKLIRSIWDNEGETLDRYTVVLNEKERDGTYMALGLDHNAVAFSQFTSAIEGKHLGKRVTWDSLTDDLKNHIIGRLV